MSSQGIWSRLVRHLAWGLGWAMVATTPHPVFARHQPPDPAAARPTLRAGAATLDITPPLGTSIDGHMTDRQATRVHDPLRVRVLVLETTDPNRPAPPQVNRVALATVDCCSLPTGMVEAVRERLVRETGFSAEALVISATHTHSGGMLTPAFQSRPDPAYVAFVTQRIGDAILNALRQLEPARMGWGVGTNDRQVFNRRFLMKPGVELVDPFGKPERVKMNPGVGSPQVERPAGPVDPEVAVLRLDAVSAPTARPLAVYANYPLHYVGDVPANAFSADYFGAFAARLGRLLQADDPAHHPPFVALLSNGASGDINNIDVMGYVRPLEEQRRPQPPFTQIRRVADDLAEEVRAVWERIDLTAPPHLAAASETLSLGIRKPSAEEVERARRLVETARDQGRPLKTLEEIYAGETLDLMAYPDQTEVAVSAVRVGDGVLVAIPCEVFVEIGLAIKRASPFKPTVVVGLANGYHGYLPTERDFELGGYETWRAKSSHLEPRAATKIVEAANRILQRLGP